jgi:hypothetical protein
MICDCTWADLEDVLAFQMIFVEAVIKNLKNLF